MSDSRQLHLVDDRAARVRQIVADVFVRRARGEAVGDEAAVAAHPDLMPELGEKLKSLRRVVQAKALGSGEPTSWASGMIAPVPDELPEDIIPGYQLIERINRGGQGVVFKARQKAPDRIVAIKIMGGATLAGRQHRQRFEQEARLLAQLKHQNIVGIHHCGAASGHLYLVMDFVDGDRLDEHLAANRLTVRETLDLFLKICDAIQAAHLCGIIHRDLKPSNILVDAGGEPHVIDFGLAKLDDGSMAGQSGDFTAPTMTGQLVGSLPWLSPEQAEGRSHLADIRTDVYALGLVLFTALTDRHAYELTGGMQTMLDVIMHTDARRPSQYCAEIDDDLNTILLQMLAKDPARRFQSVGDLTEDLRGYLAGRPISAKRDSPLYVFQKYVRRHRRAVFTVGITTSLLGILLAGALMIRGVRTERARNVEIQQAFAEARRLIEETRELREGYAEVEYELQGFAYERTATYFTPEQDVRMHALEDAVKRSRESRIDNHYAVIDTLRHAERLGADLDQVRHIRGELFLEEYLSVRRHGDAATLAATARRIEANDPTGSLAEQIHGESTMSLFTNPPGADIYLFHLIEQAEIEPDGEHRLIPVPYGDPVLPVLPGTWALRVVQGEGEVPTGSLILSIANLPLRGSVVATKSNGEVAQGDQLVAIDANAVSSMYDVEAFRSENRKHKSDADSSDHRFRFRRGGDSFDIDAASLGELGVGLGELNDLAEKGGLRAKIWREGAAHDAVLPTGLIVRKTSRPLFFCSEALIGKTPLIKYSVKRGLYEFVFRAEGYEDLIWPFTAYPNTGGQRREYSITLNPTGTTPEGYCAVPTILVQQTPEAAPAEQPFWIMEHEVTLQQYLEFLNDPPIHERIARSALPILFPRSRLNAPTGGYLPRDAYGHYRLPHGYDPDFPVFGVSWWDAQAYAAWKTRRQRTAGRNHTYSLPNRLEWQSACMGRFGEQHFVWGSRFRTKWMSSCYARPTPTMEPVMSFPIDESPFGVFDTAGSVSEWLDAWWIEEKGIRFHVGASWADGGPEDMFGISGGNGMLPDQVSAQVGFRLVLKMSDED